MKIKNKKLLIMLFAAVLLNNSGYAKADDITQNVSKYLQNLQNFWITKSDYKPVIQHLRESENVEPTEKSIKVYEALMYRHPKETDIIEAYAGFCARKKIYLKAIELNEKLYGLTKSPDVQLKIAKLYSQQGDIDQSLALLDTLKIAGFEEKVADTRINILFSHAKFEETSNACNSYVTMYSNPNTEGQCAKSYFYTKQREQAKSILEKQVNTGTLSLQNEQILLDIYLADRNFPKALPILEKKLQANPYDSELKTKLANLYMASRRFTDAAKLYENINKNNKTAKNKEALLNAYLANKQFDKASKLIDEMYANSPNKAELKKKLADIYMHKKNYSEAQKLLRQASAGGTNTRATKLKLADTYMAMKKYDKAASIYKNLLKYYKRDRHSLQKLADISMIRKDYVSANQYLQRLATLRPRNKKVLSDLAGSYMALKDYNNALETYSKILKLRLSNADKTKYSIEVANVYMAQNDFENALPIFRNELEKNPENPELLSKIADVYEWNSQPLMAESYLEKAIILKSKTAQKDELAQMLFKLANLQIQNKKYDYAEANLVQLIKFNPDNQEYYDKILDVYLGQHKFSEALQVLLVINKHRPSDVIIQEKIVEACLAQRDFFAAKEYANIFLKQNPNNYKLLGYAVDCALHDNDLQYAVALLERQQVIMPNDYQVMDKLAQAHMRSFNFELARDFYSLLVGLHPNNDSYREKLADCYIGLDDYNNAVRTLNPLIQKNPNDPIIAVKLTQNLVGAKEYEKAEMILDRLDDTNPANYEVKELLGDVNVNKQKFEKSLNYYKEAFIASPTDSLAFKIAEANRFNKNYEDSKTFYNALLESPKYKEKSKIGLGFIQIADNKPLEAREIFTEVLNENPESVDAKLALAITYYSTEDFFKALEILNSMPDSKDNRYHKAMIYKKLEMYNDALDLIVDYDDKRFNELKTALIRKTEIKFKPTYGWQKQDEFGASRLSIQKYKITASKYIGKNVNLKAAVEQKRYKSRGTEPARTADSTEYTIGANGRPWEKASFDSQVGLKHFGKDGDMLTAKVLVDYYMSDKAKFKIGYKRENLEESFISAAGSVVSTPTSPDMFVGQVVDNKLLTGYTVKLPHRIHHFGGYNLGVKDGKNLSSNLYHEGYLGIGKILLSRPEGSGIDLLMPELTTYMASYDDDHFKDTSFRTVGNYFSPSFVSSNKLSLHARGKLNKLFNTKYDMYSYMGFQSISNSGVDFIWGNGANLIVNEGGKYNIDLSYFVEDYQGRLRHRLWLMLILGV